MIKKILILAISVICFSGSLSAEKKGIPVGRKAKVDPMKKKAQGYTVTEDYVHQWVKFPSAKGKSLQGGISTIKPVPGFINVLYFVASWDIKSQEILAKLKKIEKRYSSKNAKFYYIFTHDTYEDASAFAKEYNIENGVLSGHEINKSFHHPNVPSVYVGDRHGWLSTRFLAIDTEEVRELDNYLRLLTAI